MASLFSKVEKAKSPTLGKKEAAGKERENKKNVKNKTLQQKKKKKKQ